MWSLIRRLMAGSNTPFHESAQFLEVTLILSGARPKYKSSHSKSARSNSIFYIYVFFFYAAQNHVKPLLLIKEDQHSEEIRRQVRCQQLVLLAISSTQFRQSRFCSIELADGSKEFG